MSCIDERAMAQVDDSMILSFERLQGFDEARTGRQRDGRRHCDWTPRRADSDRMPLIVQSFNDAAYPFSHAEECDTVLCVASSTVLWSSRCLTASFSMLPISAV